MTRATCGDARTVPGRRGLLVCTLEAGHAGDHADDLFGWPADGAA